MSSVSIIIPAWNAASTIERAIQSALAQPEVTEVIVVDDASTDNTITSAQGADDGSGRLKILAQQKNSGPSAARNRAIGESTASWIGILDADDFFLPGRIERLLTYADRTDFIADDACQVAENNVNGPRKSLLNKSFTAPRAITLSEFVLSNVTDPSRQHAELGFIKPLMRRDFLTKHNLAYKEHMRLGEDYELYARALALGARLLIVPEPGYISVVRANSLSSRHSPADLLHFRDCDQALSQLPNLTAQDKSDLRHHYLDVDCRLQWRLLIEAVKQRDLHKVLASFTRPWPVPLYLLARLTEQIVIRSARKLGLREDDKI